MSWADLIGGAIAGWFEVGAGGSWGGPSPVVPGVPVNPETALAVPTALACVRARAENFASLPLHAYRPTPAGRERIPHPLARLFSRPNPEMSGFTLRSTLAAHRVSWGNAYAEIEYNDRTLEPVRLWPLLPDRTRRVRVAGNERETVFVTTINGRRVGLPSWRVLHVPGLSFDGLSGYSPVALARRTFEVAMSATEYGARFWANGAHPGLVIKHPKALSERAAERLRSEFEILQGGMANAHRVAVLEEGVELEKLGMQQDDAQFLETQNFNREQICTLFNVPPHVVQDYTKAHYNNVESGQIQFLNGTVRLDAIAWEEAVYSHVGLFSESDQEAEVYLQAKLQALLRGDTEARWKAYTSALRAGSMTPREIAELEELPPVPFEHGGDRHFIDSALVPTELAGTVRPMAPIEKVSLS